MPRPATRRKRALEFLAAHIGEPGARLPSVADLARRAGVAKNTMLAAVHELCAQGALTAAPGTGVRVRHRPAVQPPPPRTPPRGWRRVGEMLEHDILRGLYTGRFLPTMRAMSQSYGSSPSTLRRALDELSAAGHLRRLGRRYELVRPAPAAPHATLVVLARGTENVGTPTPRPMIANASLHTQEILRAIEDYCHHLRIRLELVPCLYTGRRLRLGEGAYTWDTVCRQRAVVGALVWTMALGEDAVEDMLVQVYDAGVPVAVLDELGHLRVPTPPRGLRVGTFSLGCSTSDGELVGRYLLRLGHRRCAYITDNPNSPWSINRYRGVAEVFRRAGRDTEVRQFAPPSRPSAATVRSISRRTRSFAHELLGETGSAARGGLFMSPLLTGHLRRSVDAAALHDTIAPVIDQCMKRTDMTAWVAATDNIAIECLQRLQAEGVGVPGVRTVVGFDDSPEAVFRGITSFSFNAAAVVRAMADFVLGDPERRSLRARQYTFIEGHVVTRRTSGPPG